MRANCSLRFTQCDEGMKSFPTLASSHAHTAAIRSIRESCTYREANTEIVGRVKFVNNLQTRVGNLGEVFMVEGRGCEVAKVAFEILA